MRLPEPSSSQGGPFATPPRGRDSLAFVQSPTGKGAGALLDSSAGVGFFRPNVDFTRIFQGNNEAIDSAPIASQVATEPPAPNETTERIRQADADENTIEPVEEEEDEAVEENDLGTVQPLAVATTVPQTVETDGLDPKVLKRADEGALEPEKDLTSDLPADSATETPTTNQLGKSTDSTKQANSTDSDKLAVSQNEPSGNVRASESAGNGSPENQENATATTSDIVTNEDGQSPDMELTIAETSGSASLQVAGESGLKTDQVVQTGNDKLAAQSQRQTDQAATAGTPSSGENDEGSNRTSRSGRGRNGGNTAQKTRSGQSESPTATRDQAAATSSEAVVGKTGEIDPSLASEAIDGAANPESVTTPIAPTAIQAPLADGGIVAGQAVSTNTPDVGNRPMAVGGPSGELAAIGPSSSDNSGRNGDQLSSRNAENLSRTDIADRARLIHRISKAFTKMGVDGGQIRMKMHPETLGGVLLEMRVRGKNVEATVTADNEAARGLLQQQLSELRQRLESQGMTVQRLEVALRDDTATGGSLLNNPRGEMSGGDRGSDGYRQSNYSNGSGSSRNNRSSATINAAATLPKASVMTQPRGPAAPGTLDLRL